MSILVLGVLCPLLASAPGPVRIDMTSMSIDAPTEPVVLGDTEEVVLHLHAEAPDGAPLAGTTPEVTASVGTIAAVDPAGPGRWTVRYRLPPQRHPHVAAITAYMVAERGPVVGFLALPLYGRGTLAVATKPNSKVTLYLGGKSFGPAAADAQGQAQVPIVAPPGPERAVAESVDEAGNQTTKSVALSVPPFNRVSLLAVDKVAAGDGTGLAQVLVFVVDKKGAPLFDAGDVELSADIGAFDERMPGIAPGVFRAIYRPGVVEKTEAHLTAKLASSSVSQAQTQVRVLSGSPANLALDLSRDVFNADDETPIEVRAAFTDRAGRPSDVDAVRLSVDLGRLTDYTRVGPGRVQAHWVLPRNIQRKRANLVARTTTGEELGGAFVKLEAGALARLRFDPPGKVLSDGQHTTALSVRAFDQAGNQVPAEGVRFASEGGEVVGESRDGLIMTAQFVPHRVSQIKNVAVTAKAGPVEARTAVQVLPPPRPVLTAALSLRTDWNYGSVFAAGPEASLLLRVPWVLDEALHVGVNLAYLPSVPLPVEHATGRQDVKFHQAFPFALEVAWRPLVLDDVVLHLGGGAGVTVGDLTVFAPNGIAGRFTYIAPGAHLSLGAAYRLGPGELEAQVRAGYYYAISPIAFGTPTGVSASVGYRLGF